MKSGQVILFKLKPQIMTSDYSCFEPVNNDSGCFLSRRVPGSAQACRCGGWAGLMLNLHFTQFSYSKADRKQKLHFPDFHASRVMDTI